MPPFILSLIPYKDLFIVLAVVLAVAGIYGKGYMDRGDIEDAKRAKAAIVATALYTTETDKQGKANARELNTNLTTLYTSKDADGDVAPILRSTLDRLRVPR